MSDTESTHRHPLVSLLYLFIFMFIGYIFSMLVLFGIITMGYGQSFTDLAYGNSSPGLLKIIQAVTSVGIFIFPPLLLSFTEKERNFLDLRSVKLPLLYLLTGLVMLSAYPLLEWTIKLNQGMQLPGFLSGLEQWMKEKENMASEMTKTILKMTSLSDLFINLLVVAVIPAIGEEFLFRGCIQKLFIRWTANYHVGIWLAAIIFSAIHMQFYGFIPRMLLGALFGYLFVWSKSIWIPVLAHFINNGFAVITSYTMQRQGKPLDDLDKVPDVSTLSLLISVVFSIMMLYCFFVFSSKNKEAYRNE